MNCLAVFNQAPVGNDKLLKRSVDVVIVNVGNEAVDAGVDAGRLRSMDDTLLPVPGLLVPASRRCHGRMRHPESIDRYPGSSSAVH